MAPNYKNRDIRVIHAWGVNFIVDDAGRQNNKSDGTILYPNWQQGVGHSIPLDGIRNENKFGTQFFLGLYRGIYLFYSLFLNQSHPVATATCCQEIVQPSSSLQSADSINDVFICWAGVYCSTEAIPIDNVLDKVPHNTVNWNSYNASFPYDLNELAGANS